MNVRARVRVRVRVRVRDLVRIESKLSYILIYDSM